MAMNDFSPADLKAITGGGNGNGDNNGLGGDNGILWLLLFIILGGWGGNRGWGGSGGGQGAGSVGGNELYPWLNNADQIGDGFRDQMLQTNVQGIQQGINALSTQLCNCCCDMRQTVSDGFAGVNSNLCNGFNGVNSNMAAGFAGVEAGANARATAAMQQAFAQQTATMQGFNGLQAQLADCCCENRLATAQQTATILAENCADRAAISDGVRDLLAAGTANTQRIVDNDNANYRQLYDWLCNKELRDEQRENDRLRQQITALELAASQGAQTAQLLADNARQTTALEQYLNPAPIPAYVVQNPNCCPQNTCGCGCGM